MSEKLIINLEAVHCPKCSQQMPAFRLPQDLQQVVWGGWTCPHCGCRMDKWGNAVPTQAKPEVKEDPRTAWLYRF